MTARVLFVDDEEANRLVFEALCSDDFQVLTASSATEAVELMRRHEVGVVLSDQRMPQTTGVELLEQVRSEFPDSVRMLVTAHADLGATIEAINRGHVRRYVKKPWNGEELKAALADALSLYDTRLGVRALERRLLETERVYGLGVVASSLARELRVPASVVTEQITAAREFMRTALDSTPPGPSEARSLRARMTQADDALVDAAAAADGMMGLVRAIELPTRPREPGIVDLTHLVRITLRLLRAELRDVGDVQIQVATVPNVSGSSELLGQVVLNLMVNAIRAVSARPKAARSIAVRLTELGGNVHFEVEDSRADIPAADLARTFDPLFKPRELAGAGLGLAISKRIAEELGGLLEVEVRAPRSTLFRLVLPAVLEGNGPQSVL